MVWLTDYRDERERGVQRENPRLTGVGVVKAYMSFLHDPFQFPEDLFESNPLGRIALPTVCNNCVP